jgi:hypothetical protein
MCKIKEQELRGDTKDGQLVFQAEKKQKKRPKISILPVCKHRHQFRVLENHDERKEEGERSSGGAVPVSARVW